MAHSLGSIVMLDLLTRLPESVHIDLLLTVGSPMGVGVLRRHHGGLDTVAPASPRRASAAGSMCSTPTISSPSDVGRRATSPPALDAPIDTGWDA